VSVARESTYIIRGGPEGRERLRLVARVMAPATTALLDRVGVADDAACLDVGCGGGDVTLELARRACTGRVVGIDLDDAKLEIARAEAREAGVDNVEYRCEDLQSADLGSGYDLVHARFVLSHLVDPQAAAAALVRALRPGGALVVTDIEKAASLCEPPHRSFHRYIELYSLTARARGVDPDIGPRLPAILANAGCQPVRVNVVQPVGRQPEGYEGDVKLTAPVTFESIADAILTLGLAERNDVDAIVDDLYRLAADERTLIGTPRMVQAWGYRPGESA
jgi:SAM-dependent methyltransferase